MQVRELGLHQLARRLLVGGIGIGVQEADGERFDAGRFDEVADGLPGAFEVQGLDDSSVVTHAFADLSAQATRNERLGPGDSQVEQVVALLESHVEDVAKPRGHQHACRRSAPFDDRVGDQRRAVGDGLHLGNRHALALQQGGGAVDDRDGRVSRRGEALQHRDLAAVFVEQREVGERPANVDAEPKGQGPGLTASRCGSRG